MDSNALPFVSVDSAGVREQYGMLPAEYDVDHKSLERRGNYIATSILVGLRKQSSRNHHPRSAMNLEALFQLPLDISIEILSHLHPIDLYNLMRTSRSLRDFLLDKRLSEVIWNKAFRLYPIILRPPPDISLPRWSSLLFGPGTCDFCPNQNAAVDFTFRRRFCTDCLRTLCLPRETLRTMVSLLQQFPDEEETLFSLVTYTYRTEGMVYYRNSRADRAIGQSPPTERRYWARDVFLKAEEMERYLLNINASVPGALEEYEAFKVKSAKQVIGSIKHAKFCHDWCAAMAQASYVLFHSRMYLFITGARKKLAKLGFNERDMHSGIVIGHCEDYLRSGKRFRFSKKDLNEYLPVLTEFLRKEKRKEALREIERSRRNRETRNFRPRQYIDVTAGVPVVVTMTE